MEQTREGYLHHLEETMWGIQLISRIKAMSISELAVALTSPCEEERWLAKMRLKDLEEKK